MTRMIPSLPRQSFGGRIRRLRQRVFEEGFHSRDAFAQVRDVLAQICHVVAQVRYLYFSSIMAVGRR